MIGLIFELVEWMIKLTIILVVLAVRGLILLTKALMIAAAAVIALIVALVEQRRQKRAAGPQQAKTARPVVCTPTTATAPAPTVATTQRAMAGRPPLFPPPGRPAADPVTNGSEQKTCPDCAELVLVAARVCRYCGYRFEPALAGSAPSEPD